MVNACEYVFDIIKLKFDLYNWSRLPRDFDTLRMINGTSYESRWLKQSVIKLCNVIEISDEVRFGVISFDSKDYFFSTGLEEPEDLLPGFVPLQINSGLFTAIVSDLELPVKKGISILQLEEHVLAQHVNVPLYVGHDFRDIALYFPHLCVFEITVEFPGLSINVYQITSAYLSKNAKFVTLPFSDDTLNHIYDLVMLNSKILSYESIVQTLVSSQFKFAFLDLYRCIEQLYQVIYVDEVHTNLGLNNMRADLLSSLDSDLKWKPQESGSLQKIFSETPENNKKELLNVIRSMIDEGRDYSAWLYKLRCSIVHLKSLHNNIHVTPNQWNKIICGLADVASYWYYKYQDFY